MGLIDDIEVPPVIFEVAKTIPEMNDYVKQYMPVFESSMAKCKEYYSDLQEAIYTIGLYIISYEHAIESLDFSKKQLENALEKISEITDDNIDEVRNKLNEDINSNRKIVVHLEDKKGKFEGILEKLNEKSKQVVEKNLSLERQYTYIKG